jgi:hypothetical protein
MVVIGLETRAIAIETFPSGSGEVPAAIGQAGDRPGTSAGQSS